MKRFIVLFLLFLLGVFLGWIFPVEGPIDYVYDEWAENQALKKPPTVNVSNPDIRVIEINPNELSEEDFEVLYFIPRNRVKEEQ